MGGVLLEKQFPREYARGQIYITSSRLFTSTTPATLKRITTGRANL
jgi:hypothetical protein